MRAEKTHSLSHQGQTKSIKHAGEYLLTASSVISLYNPSSQLVKAYKQHTKQITSIDIHHSNSKFISGSNDRYVFLWDVLNGSIVSRFIHDSTIGCVKFAQDLIISGSFDKLVRIFDSKSSKIIQVLNHAKDEITAVDYSGYNILTTSVDGFVRIYDIRYGKLIVDCFNTPVVGGVFGNGSVLATTLDSKVRLIGQDGNELNTYGNHKNIEYKITNCFNHDKDKILVGDENGHVFVYNVLDSSVVCAIQCHEKSLEVIDHHQTRQEFVTSGIDGTVYRWKY